MKKRIIIIINLTKIQKLIMINKIYKDINKIYKDINKIYKVFKCIAH